MLTPEVLSTRVKKGTWCSACSTVLLSARESQQMGVGTKPLGMLLVGALYGQAVVFGASSLSGWGLGSGEWEEVLGWMHYVMASWHSWHNSSSFKSWW